MNSVYITCRCGHRDDYEHFTRTPAGFDLVEGQFQCPACGVAWEMRITEPPRLTEGGYVLPAKRQAFEIQRTL